MYALAPQSFAAYTWTSPEARMGTTRGVDSLKTVFVPQLGFDVELFVRNSFEDMSAYTGGAKRQGVDRYVMTFDIVTAASYVTDPATQSTGIYKLIVLDNA
jgi:hypothetical protein